MKKRILPQRFWTKEEYLENEEMYSSVGGIKSSEFKKIYNKIVNPILRKDGFKCSGFIALKEDDEFLYAIKLAVNKFGGNCVVSMKAHLKGMPSLFWIAWDYDRFKKDPSLLGFKRHFKLENGQDWIDLGVTEDEAKETCQFISQGILAQIHSYFNKFSDLKKLVQEIDYSTFNIIDFRNQVKPFAFSENLSDVDIIFWRANFHALLSNTEVSINFANMAKDLELEIAKQKGKPPHRFTIERIDKFVAEQNI